MSTKGDIKIIKASAGSGKTYTLARTYIANLIGIPTGEKVTVGGMEEDKYSLRPSATYYKHILAITFTNKATNEMKERIITQLYELSQGRGDFVDDFKKMFNYGDFTQVTEAAGKALHGILFDYGAFNVSTIDSFFQTILRSFARELDRDYNYTLELDEAFALGVAVRDFMLALGGKGGKQSVVDNWVREYIASNIENNNSWNFFGNSKILEDFSKNLNKEFFRNHHQEVVDYLSDIGSGKGISRVNQFKKALAQNNGYLEEERKRLFDGLAGFFADHNIPVDALKSGKLKSICLNGSAETLSDSNKTTLLKYTALEAPLQDKVLLNNSQTRAFIATVTEQDNADFKQMLTRMLSFEHLFAFIKGTLKNIGQLGMLGEINEKLEQFRKDTNSILIADTNDLIGRVLESGSEFIYEHVGTKFNHYMIDEFQDTSRKQYSNFKPLLSESIAQGYGNLIIGDEKQAIYRFRNSDAALLREELERDFGFLPHSLGTNYRSQPAIVSCNNTLFRNIIDEYVRAMPQFGAIGKTYRNIEQKIFRDKSLPGFVSFNFIDAPNKNEYAEQVLRAMPFYINRLLARGYDMSDIAVLVNTREEGNAVVERIIEFNQSLGRDSSLRPVKVLSDESLLLKNSPSVRLIISVLRFLDLTQFRLPQEVDAAAAEGTKEKKYKSYIKKRLDEQKRYKVLHDFQAALQNAGAAGSAGELLLKCFENERASTEHKSERERLEHYSRRSQELLPDKHSKLTSLVNIVDNIIAHYLLPAGNVENAFVMAFTSLVLDFCSKHNGGTIREFLTFWDIKKDKLSISSPKGANAMSVMTIHKSKGLEFKCVIVPFANWELYKQDKVMWVDRESWIGECGTVFNGVGEDEKDIVPPLIPLVTSQVKRAKLFERITNDEDEKSLIDNLNKLYVALTRPKHELHVFATLDGTSRDTIADVTRCNQLLCRHVPQMCIDGTPLEARTLQVVCGESTENSDEAPSVFTASSYRWGEPLGIGAASAQAEPAVMPDYQVSTLRLPVRVGIYEAEDSSRTEGQRMHRFFGQLRGTDTFDAAMQRARAEGLFHQNSYWTEERTAKLLESIAGSEEMSLWFDPANTVYSERTISSPAGSLFENTMHRRPDRLVRRPDGTIIVIDYKFGSRRDAKTVAKHRRQVSEYIRLLNAMGYNNVTGYIWYLRSAHIENV